MVPDETQASASRWITRTGTAILGGVVGAILSALPAALRVAERGSFAATWTMLAAAALLPTTAMILIFRGARRGLASFGGEGQAARASALVSWALCLLAVFAFLGAILRQKTHHHALAGVTFAITALAGSLALALLWGRISSFMERRSPNVQRAGLLAAAGLTLLFFLLLGTSLARGASEGAVSALGACVVDLLAMTIAAGVCSREEIAHSRWLAAIGPPIAIGVLAYGVILVRDPSSALSAEKPSSFDRAPAHVWLISMLPGSRR